MAEIHPNFDAVKNGLIELTPQERLKLEKDGLDVIHDIYRYAKLGFSAIGEEDFDRLKWYGVYRQKPKDSGYFMMRTKIPGGQLTSAQAVLLSELADEFAHGFCDITTRQTIQYHWLRIQDVPPIFMRSRKAALSRAAPVEILHATLDAARFLGSTQRPFSMPLRSCSRLAAV